MPEYELPTIWEVFAEIRAVASELPSPGCVSLRKRLEAIGDYDEPLAGLFADALADRLTTENRQIAERIVKDND